MKKFRVAWEERYVTIIEAKTEKEAKEKWEAFTLAELGDCFDETTLFEIEREV